jgi:hypothetical protein
VSQYSRGWSNLPVSSSGGTPATPTNAGTAGGWYAWSTRQDGAVHSAQFPAGLVPYFPGFADVLCYVGPAESQAAALALYAATCTSGSAAPQPTQPTVPAGPGPTQPIAPTSLYWNVCYDAGNGGAGVVQVLAQTSSGAMGQVNGAKAAFGPYNGLAAAQAAADADLQNCPNAPAPSPSCTVAALLTCPAPPPGIQGIGTPGTAEWCAALDVLVAQVGAVGVKVFAFLDGVLDTNKRIANIDDYLNEAGLAPVTNGIVKVIRQVFCWIGPYVETIRQSITCFRQWMAALFPKCNNEAEWGLIVIRSLLVSLEHWEFGTDAAVWLIARSGINIDPLMATIDYLIAYACPVGLPSEADAAEAWKYNTIDEDVARCIFQAHGRQWAAVWPGLMARGDKPGWREVMEYVRRVGGQPDTELTALRNLGVTDPSYAQTLQTLYDELPSISDHLEWLRKNVFDDQYVKDFQLLDGFEDRFWAKFGGQLRALGMTKENASLHYAAHWINPSFTQQFSMVQRLRPGRVPDSLVFNRNDLLRTMQEMDVGAYFRERLEAVSHPVPNLTLCLKMFRFGVVDAAELVEMLKDLGFTDANAARIRDTQTIEIRRLNASSAAGWTPSAMGRAYAVGQLTAQQIYNEMDFLGYSGEDADRLMRRAEIEFNTAPIRRIQQATLRAALTTQDNAYKCGAINADQLASVYANAGLPAKIGAVAVQNVDASLSVALCGAQIKAFKQAVTSGKITLDQAAALLDQVGVPPLRKTQYLQSWALEVKVKAPQASAAKILRWVGQGLLDREVAADRLRNLGWADPDLTLALSESLATLTRLQSRIQAQAARSEQAAAKAALKAAQQAQQTANQLRSKLKGIASRSSLQKWFKESLIDEAYFIEAMKARGYDDDSTLKYLAEAEQQRAKATKPPQAKATPGAQGNGTAQGQSG